MNHSLSYSSSCISEFFDAREYATDADPDSEYSSDDDSTGSDIASTSDDDQDFEEAIMPPMGSSSDNLLSSSAGNGKNLSAMLTAGANLAGSGTSLTSTPTNSGSNSGNANLTAMMGLTANDPDLQPDHPDVDTSVQAAIPFYGVYDFLVRYKQHPNKRVYERFLAGKVLHETLEDNPELWDSACTMDAHNAAVMTPPMHLRIPIFPDYCSSTA